KVAETALCTLASSVTSVGKNRIRLPSSAASLSPASRLTSAMATFAPAEARSRAQAAPRPEPPPLIRNVLPEICILLLLRGLALRELLLEPLHFLGQLVGASFFLVGPATFLFGPVFFALRA